MFITQKGINTDCCLIVNGQACVFYKKCGATVLSEDLSPFHDLICLTGSTLFIN